MRSIQRIVIVLLNNYVLLRRLITQMKEQITPIGISHYAIELL